MISRLLNLKDQIKFTRLRSEFLSANSYDFLFIITPGRSGSTLLRRLLMENFYIHIPPESSAIIPNSYRIYLNSYKGKHSENLIKRILERIFNEEFKYWNIERSSLEDFLNKIYMAEGDIKLDQVIYSVYDFHRMKYNPTAGFVGDKTPYLVYYLSQLRRVFPKGKYIFLVRDPYAVVSSRMKSFNESLEQATNRWVWAAREMQYHIKMNTVVVRFEDITDEKYVLKVGTSLGLVPREYKLDLNENLLGDTILIHHNLSSQQINKNRNNELIGLLSKDQLEYIRKRTDKYRTFFGYNVS